MSRGYVIAEGRGPVLGIGDKAPDFELPIKADESFRLSDALARGPVVLLTFPFAFSRG
jgi:peroxiredoxin